MTTSGERRFGEEREEVLDHAIRTAMALLTEGVVAAPTEGIAKVGIGKNDDGTEYLKIYYAGPDQECRRHGPGALGAGRGLCAAGTRASAATSRARTRLNGTSRRSGSTTPS